MLDILLQNAATGKICIWFLNEAVRTSSQFLNVAPDSNWTVAF